MVEYKRILGYVPEEANLYPHLTGWEYLELVGMLRGLTRVSSADGSIDSSNCLRCRIAGIRPYRRTRRGCGSVS